MNIHWCLDNFPLDYWSMVFTLYMCPRNVKDYCYQASDWPEFALLPVNGRGSWSDAYQFFKVVIRRQIMPVHTAEKSYRNDGLYFHLGLTFQAGFCNIIIWISHRGVMRMPWFYHIVLHKKAADCRWTFHVVACNNCALQNSPRTRHTFPHVIAWG